MIYSAGGAIVNPDGLRNQILGAHIMGLGVTLFEAIEGANGRILNARFSRVTCTPFSRRTVDTNRALAITLSTEFTYVADNLNDFVRHREPYRPVALLSIGGARAA